MFAKKGKKHGDPILHGYIPFFISFEAEFKHT